MRLLEEQAQRMANEARLLNEYASATAGVTIDSWGANSKSSLCLKFNLTLAAGQFEGLLVYPEFFPDVPAYIRPVKSGESWSRHQYGGSGVLCLEYGPDNWHRNITGVDLIKSAKLLLWGELLETLEPRLDIIRSRHYLNLGQEIRGKTHRFLLPPKFRARLAEHQGTKPFKFKAVVTFLGSASVAVPTMMGDVPMPIDGIPSVFSRELFDWPGVAVHIKSVSVVGKVQDLAGLRAALGADWPWTESLGDQFNWLALHDSVGEIQVFRVCDGADEYFRQYHPMDCAPDTEQRLPTEFDALATISVAIVGLGSLGSKIAVSLARAGVRQFLLVDDDIALPHNLVRNELNWLDVGFPKVEAVGRALNRVADGIKVDTQVTRIAGQENSQIVAELASSLAKCALVIDATANPSVFLVLSAIAKLSNSSMLWGEVFGGGGGALMARSRAGVDADALSIRNQLFGVMEGMPPIPNGRPKNYGLETDGAVYVASDSDVTALAASMSQFALDTLCAKSESAYPYSAYLLGYRKWWVFSGPLETIPVDCSGVASQTSIALPLSDEDNVCLAALRKAIEASPHVENNTPN